MIDDYNVDHEEPKRLEKRLIIKASIFDLIFFKEYTICEALINNLNWLNNIVFINVNIKKVQLWFKELYNYSLKHHLSHQTSFWNFTIFGRIKRIIFLYKMLKNY